MTRLKPFAVLIAALLPFTQSAPAADESYPARPIHLILGFAAGSSGDVAARIVSNKLTELLKQTVIVENRPGASSMVATDYVARSPKDGYTLLFATIAVTINAIMMPGKGPSMESGRARSVVVGSIPNIRVVNPDLKVKDLKDVIAIDKQKPDELLYGASGFGSGPHVAAELFKRMAGIKLTGVGYPVSGK